MKAELAQVNRLGAKLVHEGLSRDELIAFASGVRVLLDDLEFFDVAMTSGIENGRDVLHSWREARRLLDEVRALAADGAALPYWRTGQKDDAGTDWQVALENIVERIDAARLPKYSGLP